ncbi:hypothetical protein M3Y97_00453600 [Aphelenchoides bicaudatus]|nr:hypothetical protein M3Y97_00453600 [Aphelenchoides bicaudatus]
MANSNAMYTEDELIKKEKERKHQQNNQSISDHDYSCIDAFFDCWSSIVECCCPTSNRRSSWNHYSGGDTNNFYDYSTNDSGYHHSTNDSGNHYSTHDSGHHDSGHCAVDSGGFDSGGCDSGGGDCGGGCD